MVGAIGFEPTTPWSQTRCATRLRHTPTSRITGHDPYRFGREAARRARSIRILRRRGHRTSAALSVATGAAGLWGAMSAAESRQRVRFILYAPADGSTEQDRPCRASINREMDRMHPETCSNGFLRTRPQPTRPDPRQKTARMKSRGRHPRSGVDDRRTRRPRRSLER
jgi:hypothetical protein